MGEGKKRGYEKVGGASPDLVKEHIEKLKALFPEAVCEGKVDFEKLKAALGGELDERRERYSFTWAGKQDAIRLLQTPSRATLVPAFEESVNFDTTGNLFIEGDNLEVLKLLYKPYFGRVKMIYIDPPYNTGNDFIYPDNFADPLDTYLKLTGQKDSEGNLLTSNPETSGRYHSAWLSMMYPRLFLARQLLREDGLIFISIDDIELHNLRHLCDEVFGEESFVGILTWITTTQPDNIGRARFGLQKDVEYVLCYSRCQKAFLPPFILRNSGKQLTYPHKGKFGPCRFEILERAAEGAYSRPTLQTFRILGQLPRKGKQWQVGEEKARQLEAIGKVELIDGLVKRAVYPEDDEEDTPGLVPFWSHLEEVATSQKGKAELTTTLGAPHGFDTVKPVSLVAEILSHLPLDSLVLDFFAGSGTTAAALLETNHRDGGSRKCIIVQFPERVEEKNPKQRTLAEYLSSIGRPHSLAELTKERIRRVSARLRKEDEAKLPKDQPEDLGFRVFKLAASHHKLWAGVEEKEPGGYGKEMDLFKDPLLPGWTPENLIWEVALKEGFGLNAIVEKLTAPKHGTFFRVADPDKDQHFTLCLDETLQQDDLKGLNLSKDDLFICRDIALTDELAANLALQCRLRTL